MRRRLAAAVALLLSGCVGDASTERTPPFAPAAFLSPLSHSFTHDHQGVLVVYADALNRHERPMRIVTADVRVLDEEGRLVATGTAISPRHHVAPGERAPVRFDLDDPERRAARVEIVFSGPLGEPAAPAVDAPTARVRESGGIAGGKGVWVEARVENPRATPADVEVVLSLYDGDGRIVGLSFGAPEPDPVPARGEASYRAELYDLAAPVASLHAAVDER